MNNLHYNRQEFLNILGLPKNFIVEDMSLVDIAMCTSAAPLYFPAHKIGDHTFADGGLVANNPSMFAHAQASLYVENPKTDILHISLSTGYDLRERSNNSDDDSIYYWGKNILPICMDGSRWMIAGYVEQLYKEDKVNENFKRYYR